MEMGEGAVFEFTAPAGKYQTMHHTIGGQGLDSKGEVDVGAYAELTFEGPFVMEGDACLLNVSSGGFVAFAAPAGKYLDHTISGEGITAAGQIDVQQGAKLNFEAPFVDVEGDSVFSINAGGSAFFKPLSDGNS